MGVNSMKINWPEIRSIIVLRDKTGIYLGQCELTGKHRVRVDNNTTWHTTWLLDDDGFCRGDKEPSEYDNIKWDKE